MIRKFSANCFWTERFTTLWADGRRIPRRKWPDGSYEYSLDSEPDTNAETNSDEGIEVRRRH